jgi:hypothetical protein
MEWTTEQPTKEGWYWAFGILKDWGGEREVLLVVNVIPYNAPPYVQVDLENWSIKEFTHWMGPLTTPPLPLTL